MGQPAEQAAKGRVAKRTAMQLLVVATRSLSVVEAVSLCKRSRRSR